LTKPEALEAGDVVRTTASIHYTRVRSSGEAWATSAIWGRNHHTEGHNNSNAWLLETVFPATRKDFLTGRFEMVQEAARVKAITGGYMRDLATKSNFETGIGANVTGYATPGDHPWGVNVFLRIRLKRS
jgi:hypothetical protein